MQIWPESIMKQKMLFCLSKIKKKSACVCVSIHFYLKRFIAKLHGITQYQGIVLLKKMAIRPTAMISVKNYSFFNKTLSYKAKNFF